MRRRELVDIIEQAIWETDTGLSAALLAADRILTAEPELDEDLLAVAMRYHPNLNQRDDQYVAGWDDAVRILLARLAGG